jgi:hypothetical protein
MNGVGAVAVIDARGRFARVDRKGEGFREPVVPASDTPKKLTFDERATCFGCVANCIRSVFSAFSRCFGS